MSFSTLGDFTTDALSRLFAEHDGVVALVPVGSTEPHGPHLPLSTDLLISQSAAERAVTKLRAAGVVALVAPGVPYGVTEFAAGFAGAVSVPRAALVVFLRAVTEGLLATGFAHVCLVNNHLEPAHDAAVREAIEGLEGRASVACPLTRRWARTLTEEFKSGACHAGRYETSLVLAIAPASVAAVGSALPPLAISLSTGIKEGKTSFRAMGLEAAYTGQPAEASREEGEATLEKLAEMVATEVIEARLIAPAPRPLL